VATVVLVVLRPPHGIRAEGVLLVVGVVGEHRPVVGTAVPPEDAAVGDAGLGPLTPPIKGEALGAGDTVQ
jgi:hypothetical protein